MEEQLRQSIRSAWISGNRERENTPPSCRKLLFKGKKKKGSAKMKGERKEGKATCPISGEKRGSCPSPESILREEIQRKQRVAKNSEKTDSFC